MADHRTASCSVLMMPEEHSNNSACSHKQQSLLCITIVSLHLSAVPVSQSCISVGCWPSCTDFSMSLKSFHTVCCRFYLFHHVVLLLSVNSCTLLVQLFLLTITSQPPAALFQLLKTKQRKTVKCSLNCFLMCLWDLQTTVFVFIRKPIFGMTQTKTVRTCKCFVDITKTLCL